MRHIKVGPTFAALVAERTTEDLEAVLAENDIRIAPQHRAAIKAELDRRAQEAN